MFNLSFVTNAITFNIQFHTITVVSSFRFRAFTTWIWKYIRIYFDICQGNFESRNDTGYGKVLNIQKFVIAFGQYMNHSNDDILFSPLYGGEGTVLAHSDHGWPAKCDGLLSRVAILQFFLLLSASPTITDVLWRQRSGNSVVGLGLPLTPTKI